MELNLCGIRLLMFRTGTFMAVDCYARLDQLIARQHRELEPVTKKKL